MSIAPEQKLRLSFHGRIIDSLGIQMYQSPVAAVAELIANAWDADATAVSVILPSYTGPDAEIVVKDDGGGMTFRDCQDRYLNVGLNRRVSGGDRTLGGRPVLGRKGIGKFAGFGIARVVQIETISSETGERTVFSLDLQKLRSDEFVSESKEIDLLDAEGPIAEGETIEWQIKFTEKPIDEEELRGVAVYCGVKLAQAPFFFLLSGGLSGQHGQQYLTGRIRADYLDRLEADVITTERQRINWEEATAARLLDWGQQRLRELLALWQKRRAEAKMRAVEARLVNFSYRIDRLKASEAKIVKRALLRIASIPAIDQSQFEDLAGAILTAWEGGRLRDIIEQVSRLETMDADVLVSVLSEHQVLTALHIAEAVRLKVDVVDGLRRRIAARDLENAVRDYIAANPWLISPEWETFRIERRIGHLVADALGEAGIADDREWDERVDLTLSSGTQLLILEFMRPGLTVDRNHIDRFQRYVDILRSRVGRNTDLGFRDITGLLVADKLHRRPEDQNAFERMARDGMHCSEWCVLLDKAEAQWKEFLLALAARAPDDDRVKALTAPSVSADTVAVAVPS